MTTTAAHTCHAPRCNVPVSPRLFACLRHWLALPKPLRDAIWASYVPGQEVTKTPSSAYLAAAAAAQQWLTEHAS